MCGQTLILIGIDGIAALRANGHVLIIKIQDFDFPKTKKEQKTEKMLLFVVLAAIVRHAAASYTCLNTTVLYSHTCMHMVFMHALILVWEKGLELSGLHRQHCAKYE